MVSFYSPQNSRQTAQITRTAVQMAAPPSISHKTTGKRVKKRRKENEQMPVNFRLVLSRCYASLRSHKHRTAPPLASQPAGPRVSDHLSASFRGLSSVCSGDWSKTKKQKKRLHSAPHTVFEASLLLCIESFARHTIRRPAASLPVRVRPELRAERYRRPQRVRRAQSPAWFTLPSEVTLSLSEPLWIGLFGWLLVVSGESRCSLRKGG
jgi:hypothetical protein